jgi:isocitrate dehydrogenase (NAD+)
VGGLGVVPAANLGDEGVGVFEAVHGTAPDIAGQNKANPTALLLSAVLMLHHLNEDDTAQRVMQALWHALGDGSARTADLGGHATTTQFTDAIVGALR